MKLFPPTTLRDVSHLSLKPKKPDSAYSKNTPILIGSQAAYELEGPGSIPGVARSCPDWSWGPLSLL